MDVVTAAVRVVLAGVFALAAGAKLLDPPGTRRALADFGVRPGLTGVAARALPVVEGAVAAGLLFNATAVPAAVLGAALMAVFGAAIARILRAGRTPDCNCFGHLRSAPVAWGALLRNAVIAAGAVAVAAAGPGDPLPAWAVAAVAVVVCALLVRARAARAGAGPSTTRAPTA